MSRTLGAAFDLLAILSVVVALGIVVANLATLPTVLTVIRSALP
jgi:hypothetical protein